MSSAAAAQPGPSRPGPSSSSSAPSTSASTSTSAAPSNPSTPSLPQSFQTPEHRRVLTAEAAFTPHRSTASTSALGSSLGPPGLSTPPHVARAGAPSSPATVTAATAASHAHAPTSTKHLTLDSLLSQYSSSPDPTQAALEALLAERNTLASQNAQLWKLIERQRVMQKSLERDCERLRGERDRALGRERDKDKERKRERDAEKEKERRAAKDEKDEKDVDTAEEGERDDQPAPVAPQPKTTRASSLTNDSRPPRPTASAPAAIPTSAASRSLATATLTPVSSPITSAPPVSIADPTPAAPAPASTAASAAASAGTATPPQPSYLPPNGEMMSTPAPTLAPIPPFSPLSPPAALQPLQPAAHITASPASSPSTPTRSGSLPAAPPVVGHKQQRSASGPIPSASNSSSVGEQGTGGLAPAAQIISSTSSALPTPSTPTRSDHPETQPATQQALSASGAQRPPESPKRGTPNVQVVPPTPAPASQGHAHNMPRHSEGDIPGLPPAFGRSSGEGTTQPLQVRRDTSPSPGPLSPASIRQNVLQQQQQQQTPPQPYLTPADLPLTSVHISHSSIRANDRGKDVLSFHIAVSPPPYVTPSSRDPNPQGGSPSSSVSELGLGLGAGQGAQQRQPWAVEKLYSDILALDTKIRSGLGRTMQKKLGALPEGKAFRDHAPVKSDQRKAALTAYLQSLLTFPLSLETRKVICAFFTSDLSRARAASGAVGGGVGREGYKEGYLTKRGKNFGGWKTRYFVLGGRVLEYYESRGGAHLGSIQLLNAKIGRQQRSSPMPSSSSSSLTLSRDPTTSIGSTGSNGSDAEDENAYRHAFLIIEHREGKAPVKHVLCAESDEERDSWVEHLVRYVGPNLPISITPAEEDSEPRASTDSASRTRSRIMSKDEISISRTAQAVPISQLVPDAENAKLFRAAPAPPSPGPPAGASIPGPGPGQLVNAPHITGYSGPDSPRLLGVSASMPNALDTLQAMPRSNSSLGTYSDGSRPSAEQRVHSLGTAAAARLANNQNLTPVKSREPSIVPSASQRTVTASASSSTLLAEPQGNDRDRKAKSGRFWNFGRNTDSKAVPAGPYGPAGAVGAPMHAVFGVPLQDSLAIASIANLPAVVFRCIEYLEARGAEREEGIYRLSGSSAVVKSLRERFNAEGDVDLLKDDEYWDLHAVAGLLKGFLRELPTSVLTRELHLRFLAVIDLLDPEERVAELASLIAALPLPNYSLLRALTAHLILIVQHSQENKMNMRNVGIVFSPTLGIPAGVFSLMLAEFNQVFSVGGEDEPDAEEIAEEEEIVDVGDEAEYKPKRASAETGTPSSRNSRSYASGAADQLLGLSGRSLKPQADDIEETSDSDHIIHEESGTETEDADLDSLSLHDGKSTSGQSAGTGDDHNSVPMPSSATQTMFDINQTPTQAQPNGNSSKARMTATARGLQVAAPGSASDMRPMGKVGLPMSPRPPQQMSPRP